MAHSAVVPPPCLEPTAPPSVLPATRACLLRSVSPTAHGVTFREPVSLWVSTTATGCLVSNEVPGAVILHTLFRECFAFKVNGEVTARWHIACCQWLCSTTTQPINWIDAQHTPRQQNCSGSGTLYRLRSKCFAVALILAGPPVVTAGLWHTCFMKSVPGTAMCVGQYDFRGSGSAQVPADYKSIVWAAIGAGWDFTCGITADSGALICWGPNTAAYQPAPNPAQGWGRLFVGPLHVCALPLNSQSKLACWGSSSALAPPTINFGDVWTSVDVGYYHACGILESTEVTGAIRQLRCWGDMNFAPTNTPEGFTDWTSVSVGVFHGCAIRGPDHQMLCWGRYNYQLCQTPGCDTPGNKTWAHVSAGDYHTCGICSDGHMECWGSNDSGRLDITPSGSLWSSVSAGYYHTCGVKADDNIFRCWGCTISYYNYGQCNVPDMA